MESFETFAGVCVMVLVVIVAFKINAAWQRFIGNVRNDPAPTLAPSPSPSSKRSSPGVIYYRSSNGRSDYKFRIHQMAGGSYRVYVINHPSYGSRDTNDLVTHLMRDGQGPYVCYSGRITTLQQARKLAAMWADNTEAYILTGRRF